jgi:uridylate kinase
MDNNLPILVLNLWQRNDLRRALSGEKTGTLVTSKLPDHLAAKLPGD